MKISKELERRFRELTIKKLGYTKGSLQKAAEKAIARWIAWVESENLEFEDAASQAEQRVQALPSDA